MKFTRTGKAYQLVIRDGNDLQDALSLDEALWVAMSAPVKAYTCDPKFLDFVDTFKDGHLTSSEVKDAIRWLLDVYPKKELITDHFSGTLQLSDINVASANGKAIEHSAQYILKDLDAPSKSEIDLATVRKFQSILTSRPLNGDGVISQTAATVVKDAALAPLMGQLVVDAVAATGGTKDLDGTMGITLDQFKAFWGAVPEYLAWLDTAVLPEGEKSTALLPFGYDTPALMGLLDANAALVDEFFKLTDLQTFDQRLTGQTLEIDGRPGVVDPGKWPGLESHLKTMPLVQPRPDGKIPLDNPDYINPLYRAWFRDLTVKLLRTVLGEVSELDRDGWAKVKAVFGEYRAYLAAKKGAICEKVDVAHLRDYAAHQELPGLAADLAERDLKVADILKEAAQVEQLLLYLQWLLRLCNNFISFPDLYDPKVPTLFERGKIVIDGRWFNLSFPVDNLAAHSGLAVNSSLFVIYVEVAGKGGPFTVAAPVTVGDKGNLAVGKRGIFFDFAGNEYTAKIVKVIENPVCLLEAFVAPFTKVGKMFEDKVSKMSAESDKAIQGQLSTAVNDPKAAAAQAAKEVEDKKKAEAAKSSDKGSMMMGLGVAFAALSSALAFICKTFSDMSALSIVISILCVFALLMAPIILLAILKLRRQDLSTLLEGNGWAINSRMRLTRKQRAAFSRHGIYPAGAEGTPRNRAIGCVIWIIVILALLIGGYIGCSKYKARKVAAAQVLMDKTDKEAKQAGQKVEVVKVKAADAKAAYTAAAKAVAAAEAALAKAAPEAKAAAEKALADAKAKAAEAKTALDQADQALKDAQGAQIDADQAAARAKAAYDKLTAPPFRGAAVTTAAAPAK